jgi:dCTP deaminase
MVDQFTNYYGMMPDAMIRNYCRGATAMISPFVDYDHALTNNDPISFGLTSTGYDMRCGRTFYVFKGTHAAQRIDPKNFDTKLFDVIEVNPGDVFYLPPHGFALCSSAEYFRMPADVQAGCIGKSTYARCGMDVHVTPLEAGWEGILTIEISSQSPLPITIYPMEGIAQLQFTRVPGIERTYAQKGGKYMKQIGITLPRMRGQP